MTEETIVEIYTDGGCDPNPGLGGWGAVLISGRHTRELYGAEPDSTNNRMELTAAIEALRTLVRPCRVELYTDSTYLRNGITAWIDGWRARGWRTSSGQPVQNADLWRALLAASEGHTLRWHWVRGHRDNRHNNRADQLATLARQQWTSAPSAGSAPRVTPSSSESALPRYEIYARGVSLNGGTGGYGAVIVGPKDTQERSGSWPVASNVAMDLWSVIAGLQALPEPAQVRILTPSKYVVDGATRWLAGWERNGWRTTSGQAVANQSLWEELTRVMGDHALEWQHLPAEAAEEHAERAVSLARDAANRRTSEKPAQ